MSAGRWWSLAGYAWAQSTNRHIVAARTVLDTRVLPWAAVTSAGGGPSIAYAGVPQGVVKIHQMLEQRREACGTVTTTRVRGRADRAALLRGEWLPGADLVAVGCSRAQAEMLPRRSALVAPFRLHVLAYTGDGPDGWRRRMSKSERRWYNRYHELGSWALEVAEDSASFDYFYDRMHVPTMLARHGERARSESRTTARECLFRRGFLAFVTNDGKRVAGMLCRPEPAEHLLTVRLVGVLDGLREHYENGTMRTTDHLLLEWASRNGIRHVDFGGTEPFLSQGIFRWKRKMGSTATMARNHFGSLRLWWHARRDTPAVRDFLVANPMVELVDDHRLRAVYFADEQRPPRLDFARTREGIDDYRILDLNEFFAHRSQPIPAESAG